ncbi:hypothetical protein MmarC5_0763 [Methanococcus maripaludis C5]|uniref:Uncharacterized protein n=1 Tax=Methanococcus maripaludis (strain C5 / ATCC BAA-1333) TaxID=402880 RepID=A4FXY9_METM5|nr:winged helix-turn-helix transcriptional regulator [Methanococcus maripaludis]ABO35073.1 hypothetical protein MmarC5_0763 [Methanococcus maripaludis C5]
MIFKLLSKKNAFRILEEVSYTDGGCYFNELKNGIGINQANLSAILSEFVKYRLVNRYEKKEGNRVKVYYEGTQNAWELIKPYKEFIRIQSSCILEKEAFEKFFTDGIFSEIKEIELDRRAKIAFVKPQFTMKNDILGQIVIRIEPARYIDGKGDNQEIGILDIMMNPDSEEDVRNQIINRKDLSKGNPVYIFSGYGVTEDTFERFFLIPVWEVKTFFPTLGEIKKWEVKTKEDVFNIMKEYILDMIYLGTHSIPGHIIHYYADEKTDELYSVSSDRIPKLLGKIITDENEDEEGKSIGSLCFEDGEIHFDSNYAKKKEKSKE